MVDTPPEMMNVDAFVEEAKTVAKSLKVMYDFVYMLVCFSVCVCAYRYTHIYMCFYMHMYVHIYMYMYVYMYVCYMYLYVIYIYIYVYAHTDIRMQESGTNAHALTYDFRV